MSVDETSDLVTAAADLGRRDAERELRSTTVQDDTALYVTRVRNDESVKVTVLERLLGAPLRARGSATLHHPEDFAEYVNRLGTDAHTTVWADPDRGRFVAVFDDHADADEPGWRSHTATLTLQEDPDWAKWLGANGTLNNQATFADHLEDLAHTVVSPDAATMIEVAKTFSAKRSANFASAIRTESGDVEMMFEETTTAKTRGKIDVPAEFTVNIAPFLGTEPSHIPARLRYRINNGQLAIGYSLLRPDLVRRTIIAALVVRLREAIGAKPVLMGTPPPPVDPTN